MKVTILALFAYSALVIAVIYGWVINIFALLNMPWDPITGEFTLRLVGILFGPLGAVLGWFL